jgi:tripartite-type tricarboxylate transporter receptor subunit TctC
MMAMAGTAPSAQEQYPSSTVEVIVPFTAGGAVDVTGRVVAQALTKALGRSFVVINRPGANSNIGNLFVARAKPDGYTLLVSSIGLAAQQSALQGSALRSACGLGAGFPRVQRRLACS